MKFGQPMKNSELLAYTGSDALLTAIEAQRRHILRRHNTRCKCPNCGHWSNVFEATRVAIDDYDLIKGGEPPASCPGCGRALKHTVPFVAVAGPGWHWELVADVALQMVRDSLAGDVDLKTGENR